jgi:hypothetical protein
MTAAAIQTITVPQAFGIVRKVAPEVFAKFKPTLAKLAPDTRDKECETAMRYAANVVAEADVSESTHEDVARRALILCLNRALRYVTPDNVVQFPGAAAGAEQAEPAEDTEEPATVSRKPARRDPLDAIALGRGVDWTAPVGLMGQMSKWMDATARCANAPLSVTGAESIIAVIAGRANLYGPTRLQSSLYAVLAGLTTIGKESVLAGVKKILSAAIPERIWTSDAYSLAAIDGLVAQNPALIMVVDEITKRAFRADIVRSGKRARGGASRISHRSVHAHYGDRLRFDESFAQVAYSIRYRPGFAGLVAWRVPP